MSALTATQTVVLWRCPKCKVGHYDDRGTSGDYSPRCPNCGPVAAFEPVPYAPIPSEGTREFALVSINSFLKLSQAPKFLMDIAVSARAELMAVWGCDDEGKVVAKGKR